MKLLSRFMHTIRHGDRPGPTQPAPQNMAKPPKEAPPAAPPLPVATPPPAEPTEGSAAVPDAVEPDYVVPEGPKHLWTELQRQAHRLRTKRQMEAALRDKGVGSENVSIPTVTQTTSGLRNGNLELSESQLAARRELFSEHTRKGIQAPTEEQLARAPKVDEWVLKFSTPPYGPIGIKYDPAVLTAVLAQLPQPIVLPDEAAQLRELEQRFRTIEEKFEACTDIAVGRRLKARLSDVRQAALDGADAMIEAEGSAYERARVERRGLKMAKRDISDLAFAIWGPICQRLHEQSRSIVEKLDALERASAVKFAVPFRPSETLRSTAHAVAVSLLSPIKEYIPGVTSARPLTPLYGVVLVEMEETK